MKLLVAVGFFVLQPVFWLGLLRAYLTGTHRIAHERQSFGSAVYGDLFEVRHFIVEGLLLGAAGSALSLLLGVELPVSWVLIYSGLATVALLILPGWAVPMSLLLVTTAVVTVLPGQQLVPSGLLSQGLNSPSPMGSGILGLTVLMLLLLGHWVARFGGRFKSPRIFDKRRGKRIAGYGWRELLVVPLAVLVPGDWITTHWRFWPLLTIHQQHYAILILPLLLGLRLTIFRQDPRQAFERLGRQFLWLVGLAVVATIVSFVWPAMVLPTLAVVWVGYVALLSHSKHYDNRQPFWYSQVDEGVRVLGIRPQTPAEKLNLAVGDIILACNQQPVNSETTFYQALLLNPTYCHLKVKTPAGQLKVTETAIFTGAPHEIGIVLFRDQEGKPQ